MRVSCLLAVLAAACAPPGHGASGPPVSASGQAFVFGAGNGTLAGATVYVVEAPQLRTTTAADGTFSLQVPSGGECSFALEEPGYHASRTELIYVAAGGVDHVSFQVPPDNVYSLLASVVGLDPDPTRCQIATTVSAAGTAPYGGSGLGEPDATVTIDPPLPAAAGPVYFKFVNATLIVPDTTLTATTIDGGVLFLNVPPGDYRLTAHKTGKQFSAVRLRCAAGVLVNAAPPWGLQTL
jgi:hypothetical protein